VIEYIEEFHLYDEENVTSNNSKGKSKGNESSGRASPAVEAASKS